jgi:hypothetical protein
MSVDPALLDVIQHDRALIGIHFIQPVNVRPVFTKNLPIWIGCHGFIVCRRPAVCSCGVADLAVADIAETSCAVDNLAALIEEYSAGRSLSVQ